MTSVPGGASGAATASAATGRRPADGWSRSSRGAGARRNGVGRIGTGGGEAPEGPPSRADPAGNVDDQGSDVAGARFDRVTLFVDSAQAGIGPLAVQADLHGLTLRRRGTADTRRLPWARVVAVGVAEEAGGAVLTVRTDRSGYRMHLPGVDRAGVIAALTPLLSPPPAARPAATAPATPPVEAVPEVPIPPAAAPTTFERIRPLLTVLLVLAVAAMVALLLADSTGAIHLSWLGGSGARTPGAAPPP